MSGSKEKESDVERRCGTCKNWHKRNNYACKFNGPYGGGTDGVEGCKWKPIPPNDSISCARRNTDERSEKK